MHLAACLPKCFLQHRKACWLWHLGTTWNLKQLTQGQPSAEAGEEAVGGSPRLPSLWKHGVQFPRASPARQSPGCPSGNWPWRTCYHCFSFSVSHAARTPSLVPYGITAQNNSAIQTFLSRSLPGKTKNKTGIYQYSLQCFFSIVLWREAFQGQT